MKTLLKHRSQAALCLASFGLIFCPAAGVGALAQQQSAGSAQATQADQSDAQDSKKPKDDDKEKQDKKDRVAAKANELPAVLWRDPGDIASKDLLHGEGGTADAPDPQSDYTFIKEDLNGSSPKFYARDSKSVEWLVKMGVEAKPETAATRIVWAVGYFTDEDYFLPQIHVTGLVKLQRKMPDASLDTGIVRNVRLKRQGPEFKKVENWDWQNNPFVGTRELYGLLVTMALINNWDLKTSNNKVYVADDERHYLVTDLGAAFGKTASPIVHMPLLPHATKGVLKDYEHSKFIKDANGGAVTFEMRTGVPFFVKPFKSAYFSEYDQAQRDEEGIPVTDAEWVAEMLVQLTPQQIQDAFRAAGYAPEEVEGFAKTVQERIGELQKLEGHGSLRQGGGQR